MIILNQTMDRLTRQQSKRIVIPISGMGGIGKTTLARNVYENRYIVQHFDKRAWVTISQDYEIKSILSSILIEFEETTAGMDESQLGVKIHKYLTGRKYLIVLDDMWSIDVWDKVQLFFPDNGNGSGIAITTRLSNMTSHLGSCGLEMNFLDEEKSWDLFSVKVFGQQKCPLELEEIGRQISKNCRGLPLSIVVIAGLLVKSNMTREYWNHVANEVNAIVSQADDGKCSKLLSLSYTNLPVHLKPCLLYMGVYPEDHAIQVSSLIKLWVSEGFLKPNKTKTLEEVAEEYLIDLIDRNLIMVHLKGSTGKLKMCKIHDLLGDLCLREAQREKFICVLYSLRGLPNQRCIVIDKSKIERKGSANFSNQGALSTSLLRSATFNTWISSSMSDYRLIRVLGYNRFDIRNIDLINQVNLRYVNFYPPSSFRMFPYYINLLWNIQTIILRGDHETWEVSNIWEMKQLRHFSAYSVYLPEPPSSDGGQEDSIMKHLQTLKGIRNLTFSHGVVERIPNIKKLHVVYDNYFGDFEKGKHYCLSNLQNLLKLESLFVEFKRERFSLNLVEELIYPHSLKKLNLIGGCQHWQNMTIIGCLPNLEVLKLGEYAFIGEEWNPIEGQFVSLKYLHIYRCNELKLWNAESVHFPVLEKLDLDYLYKLEGIPQGIGEIPTLRSIGLFFCSDSAVSSAIDILDEQESQGNDDIKLQVKLFNNFTQLKNLETTDNFIVHYS